MNNPEQQQPSEGSVVSVRTVEIVVAVLFLLVAGIVIYDSNRIGFGWAPEGPEAGYFPFYIGVLIAIASIVNLIQAARSSDLASKTFVERVQFRSVLAVLVPMTIYIVTIYFVGIYVASVLFIAIFMRWLGRFGWTKIAPVALLVPIGLFLMFEIWFLVPLPKGPLEAMFGY